MTTLRYVNRRPSHFFLYLLPVLILIVLIGWGYSSPAQSSATLIYAPHVFHSGWSQQIGDETIPLDDIHDFLPVGAGESLVFTCTLPEIKTGDVLLFYSVNKEVLCSVDGVVIQDFLIPEGLSILKTPGSAWNQVDLDSSMSGKECTLIFHSPLGEYNGLSELYLIQEDYVNTVRIKALWVGGLSAVLVLMAAFVVIGAMFATNIPHRKRYFSAITLYFLLVLLWMLARMNFYDIFTDRPIISYLFVEFFRRMIPLAIIYVSINSTNRIWHPKIIKGLIYGAWANLLTIIVLPVFFGVSILELVGIHYVVSMITLTALCLITMEKAVKFKTMNYDEYPFLAVPFLLMGGIIDIQGSYTVVESHPFGGIASAIGCILFAMATFAISSYISSCMAEEKKRLELQCIDLENATLVNQIGAHFIFNALNTVSAYCKTDPAKADEAVKALANYLRSYLYLVGTTQNISFETELEMVENYLVLQQMRFGDKIQYAFDTDFEDFELPPFVVHTFVENSVLHGFRRARTSGTVTISSKYVDDMIQIIVADDGVGFDINQLPKTSSVGMQNAMRRLDLMRHGTITIDSTIGVGTTVTLTLPAEEPLPLRNVKFTLL